MTRHLHSRVARAALTSACAAMLAAIALHPASALHAQIGDRAVKFILPVATASGVDTITRAASPALSKALGHPVIVDNQPGAGGIVGTSALVKSPPDGFTLSIVSNNHVIYPSVYKSVPFDPIADITPIAVIGSTPIVIVVNPTKVPAKDVKELVALLKAKPGAYNYGSSGNGTILHLAAEMFFDEAGVKATHVPYKGVGPMLTDLIGGQVDIGALSLPSVQQHLKNGTLRAIGVGHGEAPRRGAGDSDDGRAGTAGLSRRRLVRRHRPGQAAACRRRAHQRRVRHGVRHARGARDDGEAGQHDQCQHARVRGAVLPHRVDEVREARQEGGNRIAVKPPAREAR